MRKKRAKFLRKLVISNDPNLLITVRNKKGDRTKEMDTRQIYKVAKKIWTSKDPACIRWGVK